MYPNPIVVDIQTPWECRWTKLGQPSRTARREEPQGIVWVCTRAGHRRHVHDSECERCEFWQRPQEPLD